MTTYGPTGSPAAASTVFIIALSIITAEAVTPGPDVADVGEVEQALDRAVLAERAVQEREDDVDLAEGARRLPGLVDHEGAVGGARRDDDARRAAVDLRHVPGGQPQRLGVVGGQHPVPVPGDAHGHHLVAVAVEGLEDARGGRARDGVLGGAAAEDEGDADLVGCAVGHRTRL